MINEFKNKFISEITRDVLEKSIIKFGELIQCGGGQGVPWDWGNSENYSACTVGVGNGRQVWIDGNMMKKLEEEIGQEIDRSDCYLYKKATLNDPLPVVIKKNGKIYVLSPMKKVGE